MGILYANVLNETEKIFLKKRNVIFLVITVLCTILGALGITFFQDKFGIAVVIGSAFPVAVLGFFIKIFLPLFIFMVGADMFTGEVSERTLKLALTKPISRTKIFISKNIALTIYAAVNLLAVLLISFTAGLFLSVKGDVLSGLLRSLSAYFVDILPIMTFILLISFVSQLFKSSSSALTTCILIYIAFYILSMFFPIVERMSLINLLDWHQLWVGGSFALAEIINKFVQIIAYAAIFFSLGSYMFDAKEI